MPEFRVSMCAQRLTEQIRRRVLRVTRDVQSGFILLESIIAITLITVIMGAVGAEYVSGLAATNHARLQSVAVQLASSNMDQVRALHPSDLTSGRGSSAVDTERSTVMNFTNVGTKALEAYDTSVAAGSTGKLTTLATTSTVGSTTYSVYRYLECTTGTSNAGSCVTAPSTTSLTANNLRAIVVVTWPQRGCAAVTTATTSGPTCSYSTSSIINSDSDLTFDLNQPLPAAPIVAGPTTLTVAANDAISYSLPVQNNKGVAPFTWNLTSGALPTGLTWDPSGTITGTVSPQASSSATTTFTVTDAYLRTASATITWTVEPALTITQIVPQSNIIGSKANLSLSATGGGGSGYTFGTASGLPPGLALAGNAISGTVTRDTSVTYPKTYQVTLSASDPQACVACAAPPRTTTTSFTWTVNNPPLAESVPQAQAWTVNTALNSRTSVQMTASGGDGQYSWSATALPGGVTINGTTGLISGTPTSTGAGTASVTVTDPNNNQVSSSTITFAWTVYSQPTATAPANQSTRAGSAVSLQISATCANSPCSYSAVSLPAGLSIDQSSGLISGTVAQNATSSPAVTVTVTDPAGASVTTQPFSWTVLAGPSIDQLSAQNYTELRTHSVTLSYMCPTTSCTIALSGAVPGFGLKTSANGTNPAASKNVGNGTANIYLAGTVAATAVDGSALSQTYSPVVTITTSDSVSANSGQAPWTIFTQPTVASPGDLTSPTGSAINVSAPVVCPNTSCAYAMSGSPAGLSFNGSTGRITGTITSAANSTPLSTTLTVTDADLSVVTVTFNWTVTGTTNNLASLFNNVGVTADTNTSVGNFDGSSGSTAGKGNTFSAVALSGLGVNAGNRFVTNGLSFTWPATAGTGQPDNVLANGQPVTMQGSGSKLGFLLSAAYGSPSGTVTVTYTDGTTSSGTLAAPDWYNSGTTANPAVMTTSYRNTPNNGRDNHTVNIYYGEIPLTVGKTVASVKLPSIGNTVNTNVASMHIFAMSLTAATLAGSFNNVGVTSDNATANGNFDGVGNSFSKTAIHNAGVDPGVTYTVGGISITWPASAGSGNVDNAVASGQIISVSGSGSSLGFLVSGAYGASSGSGVITYTDGTTQSFTIGTQDWVGSTSGYTVAINSAYQNNQGNKSTATRSYVFYTAAALASGKTVASVQLPNISGPVGSGVKAMHVFALAVNS